MQCYAGGMEFDDYGNPITGTPANGVQSVKAPIDLSDKEALRQLGLKTLVSVIQANPTALSVVPALRELLDRIDGKPMQMQQSLIAVASADNASKQLTPDEIENMLITATIKGLALE
jgi:hypothetical protein